VGGGGDGEKEEGGRRMGGCRDGVGEGKEVGGGRARIDKERVAGTWPSGGEGEGGWGGGVGGTWSGRG